jgi:penicillin-binding protein 2
MERFDFSFSGRERIGIAAVILSLMFLSAGLFNLQVLNHQELAERSENNRLRVVPIVPRRGTIYDRGGQVMVDNRPSYTVSVVPAEEVLNLTLLNLAGLIDLDTTEIRRRINKNTVSRYQPAEVKKDIPFEVIAVLEEQHARFPGVSYQSERVRRYDTACGVECAIGHVGEVSPEEMKKSGGELKLGMMVGKKGLEKSYDRQLRGDEGTDYIEVYASGQILGPYEGKPRKEATPGADLTLTIDLDLQRACLLALDSFCCGAVVVMDPRNGEILAMTSFPTWDANVFSSVISDEDWQGIMSDSSHPLLNRPITGLYPPGSTAKLLTVGAGLQEQLITANTTFRPCLGGYRFGNRVFHCWDLKGHGVLTAAHAIEQSCDIYMYQLGQKLGVDGLSRYYDLCGFGRPTGIEVASEMSGLNPDTKYYDKRYGRRKWSQGLILNNAIGQGEVLVTPLQLTQFYCGLANRGPVYKPHLVKAITYPNGSKQEISPIHSFDLPFSRETMDVLQEGLYLVVNGDRGTARSLSNKGYTIGGKTGTSQNPHGEDHSLFVGIAPLEAPEIVVCAIVENAGHGSAVAAPVAGKVIDAYMAKKRGGQPLAGVVPGEKQ